MTERFFVVNEVDIDLGVLGVSNAVGECVTEVFNTYCIAAVFVEVDVEVDDRVADVVDDVVVDIGYVVSDRSVILRMGSVALLLCSVTASDVCGHSLGSGTRSPVS